MSDVTPPSGDLPPPPPGPPGPGFWQQSSTPLHEPAPERPPTYVTPPGLQQPLGTASGPTAPELAGFWRRAWARGITLLFWLLVLDVGTYLITLLFLFINSATPNDSILLAGLAASWAYGLLVTYLIWSRSLATRRGTLGMRQMGLSIRSASRNPAISKGQAFRRSFIALLPLVVASGSGWLLLYSPDDNLIVLSLIVQAALVGLVTLGGLWMLVSPRRQTVWDIVGDTVVVVAGELIPGDGDIVWGIASVDESAITGESAPVVRESGGDRSAVTAGTALIRTSQSTRFRCWRASRPGCTSLSDG